MKKLYTLVLLVCSAACCAAQTAQTAGCATSTSTIMLDISNVRAMIMHGDMWWDAVTQNNVARYEIPAGSGKTSLFAGSIWIGGIDPGNNLHLAAQTYRQPGVDFWPGPLDTTTADVSPATCLQYDQMWKINRQEVLDFISGSPATPAMINYPGNGNGAQAHFLAPFFDNNADGIYNTVDGDYPLFDYMASQGANCCGALHGDQAIWFVFNDKGNIHGTGGTALGIEIHEQAFAFLSTDADVNNTTFYQYKIINRSNITYHDTYLGAWVDPDLGYAGDDYVGSDVKRGLGYCYNADENDESVQGYGINPPAVGIDYLQGPLADLFDGIDNDRDSIIDEAGEQIIMSSFVYYNNTPPIASMGDPQTGGAYYNYLRGYWIDGTQYNFGGNGYISGCVSTTIPCKFMFPGTSDPYGWGTNGQVTQANEPACWNWSEDGIPNQGADRRMMMAAGAFTFLPGQIECITTAAIWARASSGGRLASVAALKVVDDKIQELTDSCFDLTLLGMNDINLINSIKVYPNPVIDNFTIQLNEEIKNAQLIIFNIAGEKILQTQIHQRTSIISTKDFPPGIYFVKVAGEEKMFSQKLVLQ
jgi:hypothetical protein